MEERYRINGELVILLRSHTFDMVHSIRKINNKWWVFSRTCEQMSSRVIRPHQLLYTMKPTIQKDAKSLNRNTNVVEHLIVTR
jgi:predicted alpha/beta-fold hydrolase